MMKTEDQRRALLNVFPTILRYQDYRFQYFDGFWNYCQYNDPLKDLNAARVCEEEIKRLGVDTFNRYLNYLNALSYRGRIATSEQRFEALLRTIGKWNNQTKE